MVIFILFRIQWILLCGDKRGISNMADVGVRRTAGAKMRKNAYRRLTAAVFWV
jgi:hypothetical protein